MAAVLDGSIKTASRSRGTTDAKLPAMGARIPFDGAPSFQEWDEVTGNIQRQIRGNLTYHQTGNMTSVLSGTLIETIETDHLYMLLGNLTSTVRRKTNTTNFGPYVQLNGSTRNEHFTGVVTREYQADLNETHPETWHQWYKDVFHNYAFRVTVYDVLKLDIAATALSVNGAKLDLNVYKGELSVFKVKKIECDLDITTIKTAVRTMSHKLILTSALIGVLRFGTAFKPNALPAPTPITPFD